MPELSDPKGEIAEPPDPGATMAPMRPVVRAPSEEAFVLAREIVADPRPLLRADDPVLQQAARRVARELDDYDRRLIARAAAQPADAPARVALELAFARRIASAGLAIAADAVDGGDPSSPSGRA
jgi:hypothetical protein